MHLVSEHHDAVVCFAAKSTTNALSRVTHCIKCQEVILSNVKLITQVFQSGLQKHAHYH